MKKYLVSILLAGALLVAAMPSAAQTISVMGAPPNAASIAQSKPVLCNPAGVVTYPQYNVTLGQWQCVPLKVQVNRVYGILQSTATHVLTITVPRNTVSANIHLRIFAALGAGGTIGAYECTSTLEGNVAIARTAATAAVATASTAGETALACVAGAESMTLAYSLSTPTGGTTGDSTIYVNITITATGSATNDQAIVRAELENNVTAGAQVTIQ